jgi:DNA-directed RNA polymerase II subunit RPB2
MEEKESSSEKLSSPEKQSDLFKRVSWKLLEKYFKSDVNNLVAHHLDSYNLFFQKGIFDVFRDNNPIKFSNQNFSEMEKVNEIININLYLGGKDGSAIYFGKPVIYDDNSGETRYMYPNEARLRNLTYGFSIHYDVFIEYEFEEDGEIWDSTDTLVAQSRQIGLVPKL